MKVLNILIAIDYNQRAYQWIEYLIDAGHFVSVVESEDNAQWLSDFNYHLEIVSKNNIQAFSYDMYLDWNDVLPTLSIPRCIIEIFSCPRQLFKTRWQLIKDSQVLLLSEGSPTHLDTLDTMMTECFIEGIIYFTREQKPRWIKQKKQVKSNVFREWQALESGLKALSQYYQHFDAHDKFSPPFFSESTKRTFHSKKYFFSSEQLEVFVLYCLTLLNGRQNALYAYDYQVKNKIITKYIDIDVQLNHDALCQAIFHDIYAITVYPLYRYHGFKSHQSPVLISYNSKPIPFAHHRFIIQFDTESQHFSFTYPKSCYFFNNLSRLIRHFHEQWDSWKCGAIQHFYDMLYHRPIPVACNETSYLPNKTIH